VALGPLLHWLLLSVGGIGCATLRAIVVMARYISRHTSRSVQHTNYLQYQDITGYFMLARTLNSDRP